MQDGYAGMLPAAIAPWPRDRCGRVGKSLGSRRERRGGSDQLELQQISCKLMCGGALLVSCTSF